MKSKKMYKSIVAIALVCVMLVMCMGAGYSGEVKDSNRYRSRAIMSIDYTKEFEKDVLDKFDLKISAEESTKDLSYSALKELLKNFEASYSNEELGVLGYGVSSLNMFGESEIFEIVSIEKFPNSYMITYTNRFGNYIVAEYLKSGYKNLYIKEEFETKDIDKYSNEEKELLEENKACKIKAYFGELKKVIEYKIDYVVETNDKFNEFERSNIGAYSNSAQVKFPRPDELGFRYDNGADVFVGSKLVDVGNREISARIIDSVFALRQTNLYSWLSYAVGTAVGVIAAVYSLPVSTISTILYAYGVLSTVTSSVQLIADIRIENKIPTYSASYTKCCDLYYNNNYMCAYEEYDNINYTGGRDSSDKFSYVASYLDINSDTYFYAMAAYVYKRGATLYPHN